MKREGPRDHVHSHILVEAFSVRKYTRKELVIGHICEANCNIIISIDSISILAFRILHLLGNLLIGNISKSYLFRLSVVDYTFIIILRCKILVQRGNCYVVDFQPFWPQVFRKITKFKMTIFFNSILL